MIRIAIVEDDSSALRLQECLLRFREENNVEFNISRYKTGKEFIDNLTEAFDIVFMDIEMPEMDGLTASTLLRKKDNDAILIFITRMAQYAIKGYDVNAMDFIVKPISYPSFSVKLKKAVDKCRSRREISIRINTSDGYVWIAVSAIRYVEVFGHNLTYYTEAGKYTERASMAEIEEKLKDCDFCRCSRYCIVNMRYITGIYDDYVLVGGERIPISRRKKRVLLSELLAYKRGGGGANSL